MRVFKTKWFSKWAIREGLTDVLLKAAVEEIKSGLVEADLGGNVFKKRVPLNQRGKSSSARTILAFKQNEDVFFVYGFSKNVRTNISHKELKALKLLAKELLNYSNEQLDKAINAGVIEEAK